MIRKIVTDYINNINPDKRKYQKIPEYIDAIVAGKYRGYISSTGYAKYNKEILNKPLNIKPLNFILKNCNLKLCYKCNIVKDLNGFKNNAANSDGKQTYCISCHYETTAITQASRTAKYKSSKLNRTPTWLTEDDFWLITEIYELAKLREKLTGIKWHVDHIIPLQGKLVSGLHIPTNLQVITEKENLIKHNKY